jgi:hypothetical protein
MAKREDFSMRNCLILGCGRSGTSLMAGLLSDIGYYQGDRFLTPKVDNPKGFFEDRYINELNERIMSSVIRFTRIRPLHRVFPRIALHSNGWMALLPPNVAVQASDRQQQEIVALIQHTPYCFKDPRLSYVYPAWKPFVTDATMIVVFRHPAEVCVSVMSFFSRRKVGYSPSFIFAVWLRVHEYILKYAQAGGRWLFVNYRDLLTGEALSHIETELQTTVNNRVIEPSLNRSQERAQYLDVPATCLRMHEKLLQLAERMVFSNSDWQELATSDSESEDWM